LTGAVATAAQPAITSVGTLTSLVVTGDVTSNGDVLGFPSGTTMLFQQTAAPTGWTKQTTHNDAALRVVSGTVSSGGSRSFSAVFGQNQTVGTQLTTAHLPAHTHGSVGNHAHTYYTGPLTGYSGFAISGGVTQGRQLTSTGNAGAHQHASVGNNQAHAHSMDIRVKYVDLIIAQKD
jgi:hypothetical protein